jgi:hypothetical protein
LPFKITVGTRKFVFEVYGQLGHVPSKTLAWPVLEDA